MSERVRLRVLRILREADPLGGGWVKRSEFNARMINGDTASADISPVLQKLLDAGQVETRTLHTEGRPATQWRLIPTAPFTSNKADGDFNWRDANKVIQTVQEFRRDTSQSQDTADIRFDVDHPIAFICLSDTHIGNIGSDHDALERLTDDILSTPNLYVALLGDIADMAIRLRGVLEVTSNVLTPEQQHRYVESWLEEIAPRVLFSTWDNHAVVREENQAGSSQYAAMMKRRVIWHSGIGHPNITVGGETYKLAVSHVFRGRSIENPCHGQMRYLRREGIDREIAIAGDSHVPGIMRYVDGNKTRMAVNSGTLQTDSGYGKRYFSLFAHPVFPVIELHPDEHLFLGYWTLEEWRKSTGLQRSVA